MTNIIDYVIKELQEGEPQYINLPVLPPGALQDCEECQIWITPGKKWGTIPARWEDEYQKWINV